MTKVSVRYIVNAVDPAVAFYATHLGFHVDMRPDPTFVGGKQILLDDPSGNPVELFEYAPPAQ